MAPLGKCQPCTLSLSVCVPLTKMVGSSARTPRTQQMTVGSLFLGTRSQSCFVGEAHEDIKTGRTGGLCIQPPFPDHPGNNSSITTARFCR
ncbi:hypothetical protein BCV70DRAFT_52797 [Testicularia cyperi]|uniref:Uncharacterized protein n=1 Tax=Testicularia cyperi TaxID=1882483 RepID=A0A317XVE4_9BASI|nr:hypothetical protein BCV70DRAFT_52797 [Testicularia cyperi]